MKNKYKRNQIIVVQKKYTIDNVAILEDLFNNVRQYIYLINGVRYTEKEVDNKILNTKTNESPGSGL